MFLEGHPFWEGGVLDYCEPDAHPFFQIIHTAKYPLFYSSFSSNHPGSESSNSVPQPAWRLPLPLLL